MRHVPKLIPRGKPVLQRYSLEKFVFMKSIWAGISQVETHGSPYYSWARPGMLLHPDFRWNLVRSCAGLRPMGALVEPDRPGSLAPVLRVLLTERRRASRKTPCANRFLPTPLPLDTVGATEPILHIITAHCPSPLVVLHHSGGPSELGRERHEGQTTRRSDHERDEADPQYRHFTSPPSLFLPRHAPERKQVQVPRTPPEGRDHCDRIDADEDVDEDVSHRNSLLIKGN